MISLKARSLSVFVFSVVLLAALLHAVWNSLLKGSSDKHMTMLAIALGHVPVALMMLPLAPSVDLAALPWILASVALHLGYQLFLTAGYRIGDLTLVYPIARGSAPLSARTLPRTWRWRRRSSWSRRRTQYTRRR